MKKAGLAAVIAAAVMTAGCGNGEGSSLLTVVTVDSSGNAVSSSVVDTDSLYSSVTETTAASSVTQTETQTETQNETQNETQTEPVTEGTTATEVTAPEAESSEAEDSSSSEAKSGEYDMSAALAALNSIGGDSVPTAFGTAKPSQEALDAVTEQVSALTSEGHRVSFVLLDLATMSGISCNSSAGMCTQSVIKSVYVGSLAESDPDLFLQRYQDIHDSVAYSLNDAYSSLREDYGSDCLRAWCAETGVSQSIAGSEYPVMSSADMLRLWTRLYSFLNSGGAGAQLGKVFQATIGSAGRTLFMGKYNVQSKAGWECGAGSDAVRYDPDAYIPEWLTDGNPFNDECAANDAGIVYTGSGAYIYVIFTDVPFGVFEQNTPSNPIIPLLSSMHNAQCTMHN